VATSESYAEENPDIVRHFVGALVQGHRYALESPEAARDALLAANEELDPEVAEETVGLTVPLFESRDGRIGYQDPEEWTTYVDWAVDNNVLPGPVEVDAVTTNEFLSESQEET
jgi:ABC-type nitrate/sulfonate/bicarbonate transport system substrate-binding protein